MVGETEEIPAAAFLLVVEKACHQAENLPGQEAEREMAYSVVVLRPCSVEGKAYHPAASVLLDLAVLLGACLAVERASEACWQGLHDP